MDFVVKGECKYLIVYFSLASLHQNTDCYIYERTCGNVYWLGATIWKCIEQHPSLSITCYQSGTASICNDVLQKVCSLLLSSRLAKWAVPILAFVPRGSDVTDLWAGSTPSQQMGTNATSQGYSRSVCSRCTRLLKALLPAARVKTAVCLDPLFFRVGNIWHH